MVDAPNEALAGEVGVGEQVLEGVDGAGRHLRLLEVREPFRGRPRAQQLLGHGVELGDVLGAGGDGRVARVGAQLGPPGEREERLPVPVGVGQHAEVAVAAPERAPVRGEHPHVAERAVVGARGALPEVLDHDVRDHGLEHRDLDRLALPGALAMEQGREDRVGDEEPDRLVGDDGGRVAGRAAADPPHQVGDPAHALDEVVVGGPPGVGAAGPEAGGAAVHEVGARAAEVLVGEAEARDRPRPHAVHEGVGPGGEPEERAAGARALEVERHASLAAPEGEVDGGHAGAPGRPDLAQHVALGRLDLDDVRPHVAEDPGRIRPEHDGGEVEDPVSGEGSFRRAELRPRSGLTDAGHPALTPAVPPRRAAREPSPQAVGPFDSTALFRFPEPPVLRTGYPPLCSRPAIEPVVYRLKIGAATAMAGICLDAGPSRSCPGTEPREICGAPTAAARGRRRSPTAQDADGEASPVVSFIADSEVGEEPEQRVAAGAGARTCRAGGQSRTRARRRSGAWAGRRPRAPPRRAFPARQGVPGENPHRAHASGRLRAAMAAAVE